MTKGKWLGRTTTLLLSLGLLVGCSVNLDGDHQTGITEPETEEVSVAEKETLETVEMTLAVFIGDVEQQEFTHTFELEEGTTLLELMKEHYRMVEEDGFVLCIEGNGQDEDEGKYWVYDVNGEMGQVGAAEYVIKDGDSIDWKLTTFE